MAQDPLVHIDSVLVDGRYQPDEVLGRGSMGIVYLAHDLDLGRAAALKLLAFESDDDTIAQIRIRHEARVLAAIDHPHVVRAYTSGRWESNYFIAMEYVRGVSLAEVIAECAEMDERLPLERALTILADIASALGAVHKAGIVHRDVKPSNISIEEETGRPVLLDFGLAEYVQAKAVAAGSPLYMAPEQFDDALAEPAVDVYALAVVTFEVLTGKMPFDADNLPELREKHRTVPAPTLSRAMAPSSFDPRLEELDEIVSRALSKAPEARPDIQTFADALVACRESVARRSRAPAAPAPADVARKRRVLIVDDDLVFQRFAKRAVEVALGPGVEIDIVGGGEEATEVALENPPDLLLLDYDMPRFDGLRVLSMLRARPAGAALRVVVWSSPLGLKVSKFRFKCMGVKTFIEKPVATTDLVETLRALAARAGW
ncbi:MAG: protein kinase [Polyangiaceae bacterium]